MESSEPLHGSDSNGDADQVAGKSRMTSYDHLQEYAY